MMKQAAIALAFAGLLHAGQAEAQTILPAEFPPQSYTGLQYVDSKGCVFIRTGTGALVTWVPRLTRGREQVCGETPTLSGGAAQAPVPAASGPAPAVIAFPREVKVGTAPEAAVPSGFRRVLVSSPETVPLGYRPAWTDDRLNPNRARGTAEGVAAMNRKWSQDVPREMLR